MDFLQKYFYRVFELPLPRNAKNVLKKKSEEKKVGGWLVPRKLIKYTSRSVHFFFECPSQRSRPAVNKQTANQTICQQQQLILAAFGAAADRNEINSCVLLGFCLRRCTEASEASVIFTLEVRAPQANKKKTSTNKSRAKQAQAQAKDKCGRRQIQAPQAAKPNTRRFGAQTLANAARN
jgi:hypothetical protein